MVGGDNPVPRRGWPRSVHKSSDTRVAKRTARERNECWPIYCVIDRGESTILARRKEVVRVEGRVRQGGWDDL